MDQLDLMMQWEDGSLAPENTATLFQGLIDSGLVWKLQGCYGRTASCLIASGVCHPAH